ncbi:trehalose-phosphatase [Acinetobacter sp. RF15A]|uniref:trehalose-phosphatase n=1 Tax=unclassified Acinetobacter TaxID=196816 RepID=UPI0039B6F479
MMFKHSEQVIEDSSEASFYMSPNTIINTCPSEIYSQDLVLFLDIDGTISEFNPDPEKSIISSEIIDLLKQLQTYLTLILVTGRSIIQAQNLIHPFKWNIVGSHGLELRYQSELKTLIQLNPERLQQLKDYIQTHARQLTQLRIEVKRYSVALHFREHPDMEQAAHTLALNCLSQFPEFELKPGKYVFELVPQGANKGSAIQQIMQQYHSPTAYPIFIGDDLTDEAGFQAINALKGCSIKVGSGVTAAQYRLENVSQVQAFLEIFLTSLKAQEQQLSEKSHVKTHRVIKSCEST